MNEKLTREQLEKIRDVLEYIKYQSVYRNPALDHVQMYMPNETVDNALAGLVALTANTTEDDDYMVWAISAENQITLQKIEEYKCEFPKAYDIHEALDDVIYWLQNELVDELNTTEDEPECDGSIFTKGCPKCEAYLREQEDK